MHLKVLVLPVQVIRTYIQQNIQSKDVYLYTYFKLKALLDIQCLTSSSVIFIRRRSHSVITARSEPGGTR